MVNVQKREFRFLILHEFKLRYNASETSTNIKRAWGEGSTSDRTVRRGLQKIQIEDETPKY